MKILSENLVNTIQILSDLNYHDGDSIGKSLGITRSAVWKIIKKLENYGIKINSIQSKGYLLEQKLTLLDKNYIKKAIDKLDIQIEIFETIDSTNDYLKNLGKSDPISRICIAEHQSKARGRRLRNWHAPFGQNLYFSYAYPVNKDVSELAGLSLVIGLAIINKLEQLKLPGKLELKWPNDIIYENKKLVGILIDVLAESNGKTYVIIGAGINVNMREDKENMIKQEWNSLYNITGEYIDRNLVFTEVMNGMLGYVNQFNDAGLAYFMDEFKKYDSLYGKQIKVISGNNDIKGKALGINNLGHLLVEKENGEIKLCSSGDTSIVK